MFERYTEKARLVIFYARHEASLFGSPCIETEHLLLGLLREDKRVAYRFLRSDTTDEAIRKKIEQHTLIREKIPTSADLPLSNESERVLTYAAEEAERLANKYIGTDHLLLGLLREEDGFAAELLRDGGVTLEGVRLHLAQFGRAMVQLRLARIPGQPAEPGQIRDRILACRRFVWVKREWKPLDVLVESEGGRVHFDLALAGDPRFKLVAAGWTKDWCAICGWELNAEHAGGYTNGREWICPTCHDTFFNPHLNRGTN